MSTDIIPDDSSNGDKNSKVKQPQNTDDVGSEQEIYRDEKGRWLPGICPNPAGRPKKKPVTQAMQDLINTPGKPEALAKKFYAMALKGNIPAARLFMEYLEGKPIENINIGGSIRYTEVEIKLLLEATKETPEVGKQLADTLKQSITAGDSS